MLTEIYAKESTLKWKNRPALILKTKMRKTSAQPHFISNCSRKSLKEICTKIEIKSLKALKGGKVMKHLIYRTANN